MPCFLCMRIVWHEDKCEVFNRDGVCVALSDPMDWMRLLEIGLVEIGRVFLKLIDAM